MFRYTVFCLCVAAVTTLQSPKAKIVASATKNPRIVNGCRASVGQFPWEASLMFVGPDTAYWYCGGTIISENWIVSTGYCVHNADYAVSNTGADNSVTGYLNIGYNLIVHEDFDPNTLANDIGLVGFENAIIMDENTAPIALADDQLGDGVEIRVIGFGDLSDIETNNYSYLLYTDLITIPNSECNATYGVIRDEMVCAVSASDKLSGLCYGDTGSAGVTNPVSDPLFVAINSFLSGTGCESGNPSGFTRVASYRNWIREKTGI